MKTFGDINSENGKPDPEASDEEIRHLLWKLGPDDPLGLEPPAEEDGVGGIDIDARTRRLALDEAVSEPYAGIFDRYPYRHLFTTYSVEELRFYARGPQGKK